MTSLIERQRIIGNIDEACASGATLHRSCRIAGVSLNCWYRWQQDRIVVPDLRPEIPRGDPSVDLQCRGFHHHHHRTPVRPESASRAQLLRTRRGHARGSNAAFHSSRTSGAGPGVSSRLFLSRSPPTADLLHCLIRCSLHHRA